MKMRILWCMSAMVVLLLAGGMAAADDMPDWYSEPGINLKRAYSQAGEFDLVDPFAGKLQLHHTDIRIPGNGGLDLEIGRSYTSGDPTGQKGWTMSSMGFGYVYWPSNINTNVCGFNLYVSNMHNPVLVLPDGSNHVLTAASAGSPYLYITNQYWIATCATNGNGLIVTSPEGTTYEMTFQDSTTSRWYAQRITDRNGNWMSVAYTNTTNGVIVSGVTTSDGRSLTYSYQTYGGGSYYRLASITDGTRTWSYSYIDNTTSGFSGLSVGVALLQKVTLPDNTSWVYSYNGNMGTNAGSYQINGVTTPQGGAISYTYNFEIYANNTVLGCTYNPAEVIVGRSIAGVDSWIYAYTPSTTQGVPDQTVVTDSNNLQKIVYQHFGYNTAASVNEVWKIGLLLTKSVGTATTTLQTENYSWTPLVVSNAQNDARSACWATKADNGFNHAAMASKTITRDGQSYSTTYSTFDAYGNPAAVSETGPNGGSRTTSLAYNVDTTKWVLHQLQSKTFSGFSISRLFDANHNLTQETKNGVVTAHTYNADGTVSSTTFPGNAAFPNGLVHNYSNYMRGIPQAESQPEGINISRIVSNAGNVTSETNGRNYTTTYAYDGLNRPTSITYPAGNAAAITYTPTSKTSTRGALVETTNLDGFGRPVSVTTGGITTNYTYDALGRVMFMSNPTTAPPGTVGTNYAYDALGRVTKVTYADGTYSTVAYGAATRAVTDERGNTTTYGLRAYGDPGKNFVMSITAADPAANVAISRDSADHITAVTQGGVTRSYGYSSAYADYLVTVTNPETGMTTYGRDMAGNMTSRTIGASGTTSYAYDGQNRLTGISYPATPATPSVAMTYSATNKLLTATSGGSQPQRSFSYDANDNMTADSLVVDAYTLTTSYAYNGNDQLSAITYPQWGEVVALNPDVLGRPTMISGTSASGTSSYATNVAYWPSGQVNQITYANGTTSTYGQDSRLRVNSFVTQLGATTPYLSSTYTYDPAGNLASVADTSIPPLNRTFSYDVLNRLTGVSGPWGSGSITYDGLGNITAQTYGTSGLNYVYSPTTNLLTSVSGSLRTGSYTYDAYGNSATDGTNTYSYDNVPNLVGINTTATGAAVAAYVYDGSNKRVKTTKNGVSSYEFYDASGRLLAEFTPGTTNKLVESIYLGNKRIAQHAVNY